MKNSTFHAALATLILTFGCSGGDEGPGGTTGAGASTASGGAGASSGGATAGTGGATAGSGGSGLGSGGASMSSGGASVGTGGGMSSGGMQASGGGEASGGSPASGGGGSTDDPVPSSGCNKARTLQDGNLMMTSAGKSRQYHLRTPPNYDNTHPYRLIFMFHWYYGSINAVVNPPDADHNTDDPYYGLEDLAGDSSIFVVPQGLPFNGGDGWSDEGGQDLTFTDDMLEKITSDLCVDTSRVFTTGFSFGGAISYKLACERNDKFRAALVYDTGGVSGNNANKCQNPVAFFQSHGLDDPTFNYQMIGLPILDIFLGTNKCTKQTPPTPDQNGHTCTSFEGCTEGYPVRFCNFGAGQNNPHKPDLKGHYPVPKDQGQSKSWVPDEAWKFIEQF